MEMLVVGCSRSPNRWYMKITEESAADSEVAEKRTAVKPTKKPMRIILRQERTIFCLNAYARRDLSLFLVQVQEPKCIVTLRAHHALGQNGVIKDGISPAVKKLVVPPFAAIKIPSG